MLFSDWCDGEMMTGPLQGTTEIASWLIKGGEGVLLKTLETQCFKLVI